MGPAATKAKDQNNQTINGTPQEPVVSHPRFHNLKVVQKASEEDDGLIEISIPLPTQSEYTKWQKKVHQLGQIESVYLPASQKYEKTEFCGSGGLAWIQYKNYPYLLSDQINNRREMQSKYFEQSQLWYLIYSIVNTADFFHTRSIKVGDVRPQNVFISHEGQVQAACQYTWPNQQTNYLKTVFEKETTYLAPQQLKDIHCGKLDNEGASTCLSESFSVGLTCFDAANLSNSTALYENGNKFNYALFDQQFTALEQSKAYSQPLLLLLKGLCQVEPTRRITCREIVAWLRKYEEFINELLEFKFEEIPDKLVALRPAPRTSNVSSHYYQNVQHLGMARQSLQRPKEVFAPLPQQTYYSGNVPMVQSLYGQIGQSNMPQVVQTNLRVGQGVGGGSNANPSIITFQKQSRSGVGESGINGNYAQPKRIDLSDIDKQLEQSRKMFPN